MEERSRASGPARTKLSPSVASREAISRSGRCWVSVKPSFSTQKARLSATLETRMAKDGRSVITYGSFLFSSNDHTLVYPIYWLAKEHCRAFRPLGSQIPRWVLLETHRGSAI